MRKIIYFIWDILDRAKMFIKVTLPYDILGKKTVLDNPIKCSWLNRKYRVQRTIEEQKHHDHECKETLNELEDFLGKPYEK